MIGSSSALDPQDCYDYGYQIPGHPGAQWPNRWTRDKVLATSIPGPIIKTLIFGGQSNMGTNCGPVAAYYSTVHPGYVFDLNVYDGVIYHATEPVLGTDNWRTMRPTDTFTSLTMRAADRIIGNGKANSIVCCNVSVGGTIFDQWTPNAAYSLFTRLRAAIYRCRAKGLEPDAFLWGQGEGDHSLGTRAATIIVSIRAIVDGIRALGCSTPFYIGKYTQISGVASSEVRAGIDNAIDPAGRKIFAGFDADTYAPAPTYRASDGLHLNEAGATVTGNGWGDLLFP